jgi:HAD superfamily hydrolase (TIGR01509 family)
VIEAVMFDLDGVLLDSEQLWDRARRDVVRDHGGRWVAQATSAMQGMSSVEWARYMQDVLGVPLSQDMVVDLVLERLMAYYASGLPLLPGALEAVSRLGKRWPLGLASSSNRVVIDEVLEVAGMRNLFEVTVSSEEVAHGKPAPDVYLEAARRLGRVPSRCVAIEDSANGIRSAVAARMRVVVVPNREFRPADEVLALADVVLESLDQLTVERLEELDRQALADERLDEEEVESFPASDPHADWAGPPSVFREAQ